jgi:aspartyl-tRNA(Asn)/glutamyl-tRNA(Gln) amidotransferase subunit A
MSNQVEIFATKSASDIGRAIEQGRLDPRELAEYYRINAGAQNAIFSHVTAERNRREAQAAWWRAKKGLRRGQLDGVPISWKDLYGIAHAPNECGSRLLSGQIAHQDCALAQRAAHSGLPCLGKTHMSELAFSGLGVNPITQTSPNFFDSTVAPGGSSSGAASSVVFGCAAAAMGSDTGGSVRIPAAWNGLVGLKTSIGRLPMQGVLPLSPSLDTAGPLCRTIEDAARLFSVLDERPAIELDGSSIKNARFVIPKTIVFDACEPDRKTSFQNDITAIENAGAQCEFVDFPEFQTLFELIAENGAVVNTEGYAVWRDTIEAAPEKMYANILDRFRSGAQYRSDQSEKVKITLVQLRRQVQERIAGYDGVLCPTTPNNPPNIEKLLADKSYYAEQNLLALRNTRIGNLLDLCALTIPTRHTVGVFPGALMLSRAQNQEEALLRTGAALETTLGYHFHPQSCP